MRDWRAWLKDPLLACWALFIVTLPLARPALPVGGTFAQISDLFLIAGWAIWLGRVVSGRAKLRVDRLFIAGVVYLATLGLSLATTGQLAPKLLLKLGAYAMFVLLPVLSRDALDDEGAFDTALRAWIAGLAIAVGVGLAGIAAFYLHRPTGEALMCGWGGIPSGNYPRLCAPFNNQSMFTNYLTASIPLLLTVGRGMMSRRTWLAFVGATCVVALLTLSAGVGGFAIAFAAGVIGPRLLRGQPWRLVDRAVAGAAILVAGFFALSMIATLQPRGAGHVSIGSRDVLLFDGMRPSIWTGAVGTIERYPVTGQGYGTLVSVTTDPRAFTPPDKIPLLTRPIKPVRLEAHNVWLSVLGQAGLVGFAAFIWLLYEILRRFKTLRQGPWPDELPAALFGAVAGAFFFHGFFSAVEESRHIWALFGLLVAAGSRKLA